MKSFIFAWYVICALKIGEPKYFTTSDGRKGQKLEIKLFDETLASFPFIWYVFLYFLLVIIIIFVVKNIAIYSWDREIIQFVQTLPPRETGIVINKRATYVLL